MDTHRFFVEKMRFHLSEKDTLVFIGWFYDGETKDHTLQIHLDGKDLPVHFQINKGAEIRQKYIKSVHEVKEEVVGTVKLPEGWSSSHKLQLLSSFQGDVRCDYAISVKKLCKLEGEISYYIESYQEADGKVSVTGWCIGSGETKLVLLGAKGQPLQAKVERYHRKDLRAVFPECDPEAKPGFLVCAENVGAGEHTFFLEMRNADQFARVRLKNRDGEDILQLAAEKADGAIRYWKRNGWIATIRKVNAKLMGKDILPYEEWRKKYKVTPEELEQQRQENFQFYPLFSIIVPLYKTNLRYLRAMIESVQGQTYGNWQLCMADGSGTTDKKCTELTAVLEKYRDVDDRIVFCTLPENEGISGNTNAALELALGDYIVLADHDDVLPANALYEFAKALNEDSSIDVLYSDEDKISMDGRKYFAPHFKSDFNIDLLCSINYICHLFAVRRELQKQVGGFDSVYDGAQDYDFILRCCEQARNIRHIDKILYHWRCHMDSTAANPESKLYAFEAGRRAVEAHYKRLCIPATVENAQFYGMYRTRYEWQSQPLVSIIIPNKDHIGDLEKCVSSIEEKSDYRNFEIVIVENNSTEQETFSYYKELESKYDNVRVIFYEGSFNYSKINNFGVSKSVGEYLLLLNNDTELIEGGCIGEMLGYCMREDVGVVGAKLLYEDETIQHAGVVVGFGGMAGHTFIGKSRQDPGYFGRILCAQDYSAVTAACMMTKRVVYEKVGGLTEEFAVAFNDIDYCLKVRELGKLVVYNPYAELFHYESKSRGYEDSPEKVERFQGEVERLVTRWRGLIENGDPYYNRNLTLDHSDFSLKR